MGKTQVDVRLGYNTCMKAKHNSCRSNCAVSTRTVFDISSSQPSKFVDILKTLPYYLHVLLFPKIPNCSSLLSVFDLLFYIENEASYIEALHSES